MKFSTVKTQRGFSFTEVMISLFVLSIGFLGVIGLATKTLQGSFAQRDAAIASLLAQEGIELVFNIRDTNIAKGDDPFDGSSPGIDPGDVATNLNGGKISYNSVLLDSSSPCNNISQCRLNLLGGFYTHSNGTQTKFARKVTVTGAGDERSVEVMVYWGTGGFPAVANCSSSLKCIVATANMYR